MIDTLQTGEQLDHYLLEELVVHTCMASIYRATDLNTGRKVAVKIPDLCAESDPAFFSRFQREIEIGKSLDHPRVVKTLMDGDRSRLYMVMEWLEGRRLRTIMGEEGKLPAGRAVKITLGICEALDYIHRQGVVHRDLKPDNVMIDANDNVTLFDFGISSLAGSRRLTFSKLTNTLGTPDYISPEQVRGKRGDARSDIYALGAMLYEMLTGLAPFNGPNALVIMQDRLLNDPTPPRELDPNISPQLQEVIYRAMERDPRKRYGSVEELASDLRSLDQVGIADRRELHSWRIRRSPRARTALSYALLALIPVAILALLLFVARH